MRDQKVLLLGANGQLGHQLQNDLSALGEVKALTREQADLSQPLQLKKDLLKIAEDFLPTVVINAAAYTAVDKAESELDAAWAINAESPGVLAGLTQEWNAMLLHYSTDYVFDGSGDMSWKETDRTGPLSVYGKSKLAGERAVIESSTKHILIRTSWVVGSHGGNFLKTMLRLASERDSLRVVADQFGAPTSTGLLSEVTIKVIEQMLAANEKDSRWGVYHCAAAGETSWHRYAQYVVSGAIARGAEMKVKPHDIEPISTDQYPLPAPRPANSRLNTKKIQEVFGVNLPLWTQGVDTILDQLFEKKSI